jgi:hypothetical protein
MNVAANVVGLGLATVFRFYGYRRWVFAPQDRAPAPDRCGSAEHLPLSELPIGARPARHAQGPGSSCSPALSCAVPFSAAGAPCAARG